MQQVGIVRDPDVYAGDALLVGQTVEDVADGAADGVEPLVSARPSPSVNSPI